MRLLWTGTFDPEFSRNSMLRRLLDRAGVECEVIRYKLWPEDRVGAVRRQRLSIVLRMLVVYPMLFIRLMAAPRPDLYLVSYPGYFDVPIVRLVSTLKRRPLVYDIFISLHETVVEDRGLVAPGTLTARMARLADATSIRMSHRVVADTAAHAAFFSSLANVDQERFSVLPLGANEGVFVPLGDPPDDSKTVLFYGTFVPLQGADVIVRAADLLRSQKISFRLVGDGQDRKRVAELAERLAIDNIEFVEQMRPEELVAEIQAAALCLGVFGSSPKADRVVPHKVFEALASQRPVVTGATTGVVSTFAGDEIALCPAGDHVQLAAAIDEIMSDRGRAQELARRGYERFLASFSTDALAREFRSQLEGVVRDWRQKVASNPSVAGDIDR